MSEHRRDIQFEIQYLLSLTLVVFGMLSITAVREGMNEWVAYLVIFFLAAYLSVFNIVYAFGQATSVSVDMVNTIERWSAPILVVIGGSFLFLVLHTAFGVVYLNLSETYGTISSLGIIIIKYIGPLTLVATMGYSIKRRGVDPLKSFEGVNIKIVPEDLRVFQTQEASRALLVKVENNGDETFTYELEIDVPEVVTLHKEGDLITNKYEAEGSVEPGRADRYSFELSHISEEHSADELKVTIDGDGAFHSTDVQLELAV